jgi:hypothetical protein
MATSTTSPPLNAEPSRPDERKNQDLQPKSYVDAVRGEPAETANEIINGPSRDPSSSTSPNGIRGPSEAQQANGGTTGISVLRIINTHNDGEVVENSGHSIEDKSHAMKVSDRGESNGDSISGTELQNQERRPSIERQESKHEFSATVRRM